MNNAYISSIHEDLDSFYENLISKLSDVNDEIPTIIEMLEALHGTENFNELAELVEDEMQEGETYKLFHEIIKFLPQNKNFVEEIVSLVSQRDLISPEDLEVISTWSDLTWDYDSDDYNRSKCGMATAACNTRTEPEVLAQIASQCSWEIACRVAANPRTSWETLFSLASRAIDETNSFGQFAIPSVILPMFMRADITEANLYKLRTMLACHEVIELVDKCIANQNDPEVLRQLL